MPITRIAIVTDVHHGADRLTKKGSAALPLLRSFSDFVATERPDAVVDLGDRITDRNRADDFVLAREVADAFRAVPAPLYHLCGNHDRDYLSVADNEDILGQSLGHQTVDLGDWRLVLWRADSLIRRPGGFVLTEADLLWLAGVVRLADRPLAIMSHVPVSGHGQTGNYYFEHNPELANYPGCERARAVLRAATVPVVWISGHVHWNTLTLVDGIPHFTLQSLTESFTTYPEPAAAWGLLELGDSITWTVAGRDPFAARFPTEAAARRWITPLPPFDQHPETRVRRLARTQDRA
jgi:Icc protein